MKLRLKKDIVIKAGTVFDDNVPINTNRTPNSHVEVTLGFGRNASGSLIVGHEMGDLGFRRWFEPVAEPHTRGARSNRAARSKKSRRAGKRGAHGKTAKRDARGQFAE